MKLRKRLVAVLTLVSSSFLSFSSSYILPAFGKTIDESEPTEINEGSDSSAIKGDRDKFPGRRQGGGSRG